ncbi:MerR family transcriptional regulator [Salinibius halmophilus]|uniref:MerR family transcriptional regulator n=1 Tax=Salinibius halmophilus TaxID=1853216 RepID=UPI000E6702D8|nr:MerR family transcriptional regulator [Salinibius halmophilus]
MSTMNAAEVAKLMGVTESNVRRWAKEKLLQPVDPKAGMLEFDKEAVMKYKDLHERLYGRK